MKQIMKLVKLEYLNWLCNARNIILLVFVFYVRETVALPMIYAAKEQKTVLNCYESSIAVANSGVSVLLISVLFITLISDIPRIENDFYNIVCRIGMKKWCKAQMIFSYLIVLTVIGFVIFSIWVQTVSICYVEDAWSLVVTESEKGSVINNLIPLNLYNQMPPLQAFIYTYVLLFLYFLLTLNVVFVGTLYGKKSITTMGLIIWLGVGVALAAARVSAMWLFPVSHSILLLHCDKYYRAQIFPIWLSVMLLVLVNVFLTIVAYKKMLKVNCSELKEAK